MHAQFSTHLSNQHSSVWWILLNSVFCCNWDLFLVMHFSLKITCSGCHSSFMTWVYYKSTQSSVSHRSELTVRECTSNWIQITTKHYDWYKFETDSLIFISNSKKYSTLAKYSYHWFGMHGNDKQLLNKVINNVLVNEFDLSSHSHDEILQNK